MQGLLALLVVCCRYNPCMGCCCSRIVLYMGNQILRMCSQNKPCFLHMAHQLGLRLDIHQRCSCRIQRDRQPCSHMSYTAPYRHTVDANQSSLCSKFLVDTGIQCHYRYNSCLPFHRKACTEGQSCSGRLCHNSIHHRHTRMRRFPHHYMALDNSCR